MNNEAKSDKTYVSGLSKPGFWLFVYIFFAVIPVVIYLGCYEYYVENSYINGKDTTIKYYQRELTGFRSRATNKNIFLQVLQSFRDNCRRNLPDYQDGNNKKCCLFHALSIASFQIFRFPRYVKRTTRSRRPGKVGSRRMAGSAGKKVPAVAVISSPNAS